MQDNYKDILSHLSTEIDQETLLLYLQGKLTDEKKHEIEKKLLENDFADDALEGLQQFKDKQQLSYTVELLNRELKKKLERKEEAKNTTERTILVLYRYAHTHSLNCDQLYCYPQNVALN